MLKYVDTLVSFSEVPNEISLCISISNCHCHCKGCHSSYLAKDIGKELNIDSLCELISSNKGITCVCLMGGDSNPEYINILGKTIKQHHLKSAWYSGRQELSKEIDLKNFDAIKLGPYIEELGPLNSKTTNQRFYEVVQIYYEDGTFGYELIDVTYKFYKNED